jgi:glutathione synthase/RimK-type ligase-like ATP-grasp enzyme
MKKTNHKNVVVIYKANDWNKTVPITSDATRKAFEDWHERGVNHGVEIYRASIKWYDIKKNVFSKAWAYRDGKWIKITEEIKPDMIFDKIKSRNDYQMFDYKMEISRKVKLYNAPLFRTILDNKLGQYMILEEFMPKSYLALSKHELERELKKIKTKKVVIKPLYGSGGFGITIIDRSEKVGRGIEYPVLLQEFVNGGGIPGFSKKGELADLRLIYQNNELVYALSRIAKGKSLFTNFHQGATAVLVNKKNIPGSVTKMASQINKKLNIFTSANYSLDFIFDKKGSPLLIEMNTTPGFDLLKIVGDEDLIEKNFVDFINILVQK